MITRRQSRLLSANSGASNNNNNNNSNNDNNNNNTSTKVDNTTSKSPDIKVRFVYLICWRFFNQYLFAPELKVISFTETNNKI